MSVFNHDYQILGSIIHVDSTMLEGFPGMKQRTCDAETVMGPMQRFDIRFYQLGIPVPGDFDFGCMCLTGAFSCDW